MGAVFDMILPILLVLLQSAQLHAVTTLNVPRSCITTNRPVPIHVTKPVQCPCLMRNRLRRYASNNYGARFDFLLFRLSDYETWKSDDYSTKPKYIPNYSTLSTQADTETGEYDGGEVEINTSGEFVLVIRAESSEMGVPDCETRVSLIFEQRPPPCPTRLKYRDFATHKVVGGRTAPDLITKVAAVVESPQGDCSASVIGSEWLITAAHCHVQPNASAQIGGIHSEHGKNHTVTHVVTHPRYRTNETSGLASSDIAILRVTPAIHQPRIVYLNGDANFATDSGWASAAGYGRIAEGWTGDTKTPRWLHSVDLPIVSTKRCKAAFRRRNAIAVANDVYTKRHICAGYIDAKCLADTCSGDSGGMLVTKLSGEKLLLIGVTSGGLGCARPGIPGVYARVSTYAKWIVNTTNGNATIWPSSSTASIPTRDPIPRWAAILICTALAVFIIVLSLCVYYCCYARKSGNEQTEFHRVAKPEEENENGQPNQNVDDDDDDATNQRTSPGALFRRWLRRTPETANNSAASNASDDQVIQA